MLNLCRKMFKTRQTVSLIKISLSNLLVIYKKLKKKKKRGSSNSRCSDKLLNNQKSLKEKIQNPTCVFTFNMAVVIKAISANFLMESRKKSLQNKNYWSKSYRKKLKKNNKDSANSVLILMIWAPLISIET